MPMPLTRGEPLEKFPFGLTEKADHPRDQVAAAQRAFEIFHRAQRDRLADHRAQVPPPHSRAA